MQSNDLFLFLALAVLIFIMFWNNRKRKKQAAELQNSIKKGAHVVLHSGIFGTISSVQDDRYVIESAGSTFVVAKGAVRGLDLNAKTVAAPKQTVSKAAPKPAAAKVAAAAKPVAKSVVKPAAKPATKSAAKPAAKPAAK
jgi:preprotein translocase YajC subunit